MTNMQKPCTKILGHTHVIIRPHPFSLPQANRNYNPTSIIRTPLASSNIQAYKQKVRIIKSIFDVQLTTPTPISCSTYLRLNEHFDVSSQFWLRITAHTLHDLLERYFSAPKCHLHKHNKQWLHCTLLHMRTSISHPIFVLWPAFLLGSEVRIIEVGLYHHTLVGYSYDNMTTYCTTPLILFRSWPLLPPISVLINASARLSIV